MLAQISLFQDNFRAKNPCSLPLGPGGAKDTSHLLLNKKWIFFAFFGAVFFVWMCIASCVRGRKKFAWYMEQRKYSRLSQQLLMQGNDKLDEASTRTATAADAEEDIEIDSSSKIEE